MRFRFQAATETTSPSSNLFAECLFLDDSDAFRCPAQGDALSRPPPGRSTHAHRGRAADSHDHGGVNRCGKERR
eukprot:2326160-Prymnesium_polylepis.1